jgi:dihydrofolate reductase
VKFHVIVAVDRAGGMAKDGGMPWHLPGDLAWFRRHTVGAGEPPNRVLMGRRTWESLPERFRPLPGRVNLVLSRDPAYAAPGATVVGSLDAALAATPDDAELWVVGGGEVYRIALAHPACGRILVTEIDAEYGCDVFFPSRDALVSVSEQPGADDGDIAYVFREYARAAATPEPGP